MLEVRSNQDSIIESKENMLIAGYAVVFDSPTKLYSANNVDYYEVVKKEALTNCDMSDVVLRYNHKDNTTLLARTSNNTLTLTVDEIGLYFEAELANTTAAKDIYELIKRGDLNKMSFAFTVDKDFYVDNTRYINAIKTLKDVSVVDFPAYSATVVEAVYRNFDNMEAEAKETIAKEKLKTVLLTY